MHSAPRAHRTTLVATIAAGAGNLVEWYDWFVYSAFSLYFAERFFSEGDQTARLLQTAGIFALGYVMRPLGAWALGRLADRAGRRHALVVSIGLMCGGSFVIAILPDRQAIGAAAPVILLVARMFQGFALGGEYGASAAYMAEMARPRWRGFWSSFHIISVMAGQVLAIAVLALLQALLDDAAIARWGWRLAFALGGLIGLSALWIRRIADEAPRTERAPIPTSALLREHRGATFTVFALTTGGAIAFYAFTTYMQKFLVNTAGFARGEATTLVLISYLLFMAIQPIVGALSDRIGRKAILALGFGAGALFTFPLMTAIAGARTPMAALGPMLALMLILSGYTAVNSLFKAELFPAAIRGLGIGLPYAMANVLFGGTSEYVALALKQAGREPLFFVYVSAAMALALIVTLLRPDPARVSRIADPAAG